MLYTNTLSNLLQKISLVLAPSSQASQEETIVRYVNTKVFQNKYLSNCGGKLAGFIT